MFIGISKINKTCSAFISATQDRLTGCVKAEYCLYHVGHDNDVRHLRRTPRIELLRGEVVDVKPRQSWLSSSEIAILAGETIAPVTSIGNDDEVVELNCLEQTNAQEGDVEADSGVPKMATLRKRLWDECQLLLNWANESEDETAVEAALSRVKVARLDSVADDRRKRYIGDATETVVTEPVGQAEFNDSMVHIIQFDTA